MRFTVSLMGLIATGPLALNDSIERYEPAGTQPR